MLDFCRGNFGITYKGRCDRTWWDSHAIWNPYADIAWEHEVGTPFPATKRPVVTRHDNDPDADPKPTYDQIRDIHRRWQARGSDDNGDDNGGDDGN